MSNQTYKIVMNCLKSSLLVKVLSLSSVLGTGLLFLVEVKASGFTQCQSISINNKDGRSRNTFKSAKLENTASGYVLNFNTGGKVKIRPNLTVVGSYYTDEPSIDSKIKIEPNGRFQYHYFSTSRITCDVKGTLTFGTGVKQKLFGRR
jgi:hypothetical protein